MYDHKYWAKRTGKSVYRILHTNMQGVTITVEDNLEAPSGKDALGDYFARRWRDDHIALSRASNQVREIKTLMGNGKDVRPHINKLCITVGVAIDSRLEAAHA